MPGLPPPVSEMIDSVLEALGGRSNLRALHVRLTAGVEDRYDKIFAASVV
jgi:hypothetical protein